MKLGENIFQLRKKRGISQEQLGEQINVTRQTISNWELGETSPNPEQLKLLSKTLDVSVDKLLDNEIKEFSPNKTNNHKKLSESILKIIVIVFLIFLLIDIIVFILFTFFSARSEMRKINGEYSFICTLDNEDYLYEIEYNENYQIINAGGNAYIANHTDVETYDDANRAKAHIEDWFKEHNGSCITEEK